MVELLERANHRPLPGVQIVDMRNELKNGNKKMFSELLRQEIINTMEQGNQLILFLNRRGYATFVSCRDCGFVLQCPNCNISLTYHMKLNKMSCHYCGYNRGTPQQCPSCKSKHIRYFGTGTQKIEEEFQKEFQTDSTIRMDADTTTKKNAHLTLLERFRNEGKKALIGTQMIAKGHDFPNVTLVGVVAADSGMFFPDYRSAEKNFQLIEQVAGRSGRAEKEGKVIVQTYNPEHYSIVHAKNHDYVGFYLEEIKIRELLAYPPFTWILNIIVSGEEKQEVVDVANLIKDKIKNQFDNKLFELLGPTAAPIDKIKSRYRWQILIKAKKEEKIREIMRFLVYNELYKKEAVTLSLDINPTSML